MGPEPSEARAAKKTQRQSYTAQPNFTMSAWRTQRLTATGAFRKTQVPPGKQTGCLSDTQSLAQDGTHRADPVGP